MSDLLEKDYEDWICKNLAQVVGHDDATLLGRQMHLVDGGCLDVLALRVGGDAENTIHLTVVEVKRDVVVEAAVGQILSYIGALREMTAKIKRHVVIDGVLVAPSISLSARLALEEAPALRFMPLRAEGDTSPITRGKRASKAVTDKLITAVTVRALRLTIRRVRESIGAEV